jgi:hypothetical protein
LLEYTRQRANGGSGWSTSAAPEPVTVRMKAPARINSYQTIKGRTLVVDADGVVMLTETEAAPLTADAGWIRLAGSASEATGG